MAAAVARSVLVPGSSGQVDQKDALLVAIKGCSVKGTTLFFWEGGGGAGFAAPSQSIGDVKPDPDPFVHVGEQREQ